MIWNTPKALLLALAVALALPAIGCNKRDPAANQGSGGGGIFSGGGSAGRTGESLPDCQVVVYPADPSGGCYIELRTPSVCQEVDLSGGRSFEFAWSTNGSGCETPWKLYLAGNPVTRDNVKEFSYSTNVEAGITRTGGVVYLSGDDFAGLTSDNGLYHWVVESYYGAHPSSIAFRVRK